MIEDGSKKPNQNRRGFLKYILSGGLIAFIGSVIYPIIAYLIPPKQTEVKVSSVNVGKIKDIPPETGQIIKFGNKPVILIRDAKGEFHANSATCTHLDCTVQYKKDQNLIWCACHNGKYDLNGKNISGPPPRPLDPYKVTLVNDEVIVSQIG